MWRNLPTWSKVLIVLVSIVVFFTLLVILLAKFWLAIVTILVLTGLLYGWMRFRARERRIDMFYHWIDDADPRRSIGRPPRLDSSLHVPRINQRGVDFITSRRRR